MRACRNTVLAHRKRGERLRCRNRNCRNHQKHQMAQARSLCGQAGVHPKIGSPWVPGYPTDLSSVTAGFQHCVGASSPSMAADRTTQGRISPHCERVGVAPWRSETNSPFARGRSAVSHIFLQGGAVNRLRRAFHYIAMWNCCHLGDKVSPQSVPNQSPVSPRCPG
jgi:hypothetical protein